MNKNILLSSMIYFFMCSSIYSLQIVSNRNDIELNLDHVVVVVPDLNAAIQYFKKLNLFVYSGGTPAGGFDHNAIIPLKDGSYIELYATVQKNMMQELAALHSNNRLSQFTQKLNPMDKRFVNHVANGPGFADYALLVTKKTLGEEILLLNKNGLPFKGPITMSRINPAKQKLIWVVGVPQQTTLPFLIQDKTSRNLRSDQSKTNINDVSISNIMIAVNNIDSTLKEYELLFGKLNFKKTITDDHLSVDIKFKKFSITLVQPNTNNTKLKKFIQIHGEGPYYLELQSNETRKINNKKLRMSISAS